MSDLYIDLEDQINELWDRRRELLAIRVSPPGPTPDDKGRQRIAIDATMVTFLDKITALERMEDDRKASQITVKALTDKQKADAEMAMAALSRSIQKEQGFDAIMNGVQGVLAAADTITQTAKT
jgi:hypothetical protein